MNALRLNPLARKLALFAVPVFAILLARALTHSDWAASNATLAAWLFAWIVVDTLCLATIAKAPRFRPGLSAMLGASTLAGVVVIAGAAPQVRARILETPTLLSAFGLTAAAWIGVAASRVITLRRDGADWESAFAAIMPSALLKFLMVELRMLHLALFRWGGAPDIPPGSQAFSYHRFLAPMLITFGVLQVLELGVVHLLLMLWNPTVAWVVFALTLAGLLWFVALTKSLRLMPVLVREGRLRIRAGTLADFDIPYGAIATIEGSADAETLKEKSTFNAAVLSSPNVVLKLAEPVALPGPFGGIREIELVALRLDDPAGFHEALADKLGDR